MEECLRQISAEQPKQAAETFVLYVEGEMKRLRLSRSTVNSRHDLNLDVLELVLVP